MFSLGKRRPQKALQVTFQYLQGVYRNNGDRLSIRECSDRTKGNGFKLKQDGFGLDIRKKFFTWRVTEHWNKLPTEAVESFSLEIFKTHLGAFLCDLP